MVGGYGLDVLDKMGKEICSSTERGSYLGMAISQDGKFLISASAGLYMLTTTPAMVALFPLQTGILGAATAIVVSGIVFLATRRRASAELGYPKNFLGNSDAFNSPDPIPHAR